MHRIFRVEFLCVCSSVDQEQQPSKLMAGGSIPSRRTMRVECLSQMGLLHEFISCHHGRANRLLHVVGTLVTFAAVLGKSLLILGLGLAIQEAGHFYQFAKTRKRQHSPVTCLRGQFLFAFPLIALAAFICTRP